MLEAKNLEKQILIIDTSSDSTKHLDKIKIPKILILSQNEKYSSKNKFNIIINDLSNHRHLRDK